MRSHAKAPSFGSTAGRRALLALAAIVALSLALGVNPAAAIAPTAQIDPPTDASYTSIKASGDVDPGDQGTYWSFETSTDGGANWSGFSFQGYVDPSEVSPGESKPVERELTDLKAGTEYKLRLTAWNFTDPQAHSAVESFTTLPVAKPSVTLDPVSAISGEGAHFEGQVNPNASGPNSSLDDAEKAAYATTYRFECTPVCPNAPAPQTIAADDQPQSVEFDANELEPDTDYEVSLIAENAGGQTVQTQSFATAAAAPRAATHVVGDLGPDHARLSGFVDPQNQPTTYYIEWGRQPDLSDAQSLPATEDGAVGSDSALHLVVEDVAGLQPETTYYFRVVGESAVGTTLGETERFNTRSTPPSPGPGVGAYGDRALEMVSDPEKNGNALNELGNYTQDGNRVLYAVEGGTATTTVGDRFVSPLVAERTPTGWVSRSGTPPRSEVPYPRLAFVGASSDLSHTFSRGEPEVSIGTALEGDAQWFGYRPQTATTLPLSIWSNATEESSFLIATPKLEHVVGWGKREGGPLALGQVYDYGTGGEELVSLLPGDEVPDCGADVPNLYAEVRENPATVDGRRVFFKTAGDGDCGEPPQLYMREAAPDGRFGSGTGATTTLLSAPALSGSLEPSQFISASADGSSAYFTTRTRLAAADSNADIDLYRYTVGEGKTCLTCVVANADLVGLREALVSEDGDRVYFASRRALASGARPPAGTEMNLYALDVDAEKLKYVAPINGVREFVWSKIYLSAEGRTLAFTAPVGAELDAVTNSTAVGTEQLFHYDERANALECLSCPDDPDAVTTQAPLVADGRAGPRGEVLSADGEIAVFATDNALVPGDVNGTRDTYEWRDGVPGLLTDGVEADYRYRKSYPFGVTRDGRSVFFLANDLLPGADGSGQVYGARIGGGFAPPVPPRPCAGDGCQGAPTAPSASAAPASAAFSGPGNSSGKPKARCGKPKVKRKGRCVKKESKRKTGRRTAGETRRTSK